MPLVKNTHGSHCSCFGFEGQFELEETTLEYLKSGRFSFYGSTYDDETDQNGKMLKNFIERL
jgi:hypothetical protein